MEDKIKIHFVETKTSKSPQSNLKNMIWETISEPTPILFAHGEQTKCLAWYFLACCLLIRGRSPLSLHWSISFPHTWICLWRLMSSAFCPLFEAAISYTLCGDTNSSGHRCDRAKKSHTHIASHLKCICCCASASASPSLSLSLSPSLSVSFYLVYLSCAWTSSRRKKSLQVRFTLN